MISKVTGLSQLQGSEHSKGSCESGRRWQLKGQLKEKRSRAWLHCCSAEEQTERQGWRTPPWGLHWGRNIPQTSLCRGSKHASSISTWMTKGGEGRWFDAWFETVASYSSRCLMKLFDVTFTRYCPRRVAASLWSAMDSQMLGNEVKL